MKKTIFTIMICAIIIISPTLSTLASASSIERSNIEDTSVQVDIGYDTLNPSTAANEALVSRGQAIIDSAKSNNSTSINALTSSYPHTAILSNFTHYYQSGQLWSSDIMQTEGLTIGTAGCCLTSFAMIQNYFSGVYNPRGVNTQLGNAACWFNYSTAASIFGYTIESHVFGSVTDSYATAYIVGAIDSCLPVLVGMVSDLDSDDTHFVAAYGYTIATDGTTTIYIRDPSSARDYSYLSQYFSSWSVNRLYVYSN